MKKIIILILSLYCFFIIDTTISQWQPWVTLTSGYTNPQLTLNNARSLAATGEFVHVVWYDAIRPGVYLIYYIRSTDEGTSWESIKALSDTNNAWVYYPSIIASGQFVHIVWTDHRDGNSEIYYKRSTNNGVDWESDVRLTYNPLNSVSPCISASGSVLHLSWLDDRDGNQQVYYKRSTNSGVSWGSDISLSANVGFSGPPSISSYDSNLHIVWHSSGIKYKRSTNGGLNWSNDTVLYYVGNYLSNSPSIAVAGSDVYVVWEQSNINRDIRLKHSENNGVTWKPEVWITNEQSSSVSPSVSVTNSNIHILWCDFRTGNVAMFYKHSSDWGRNWGPDTRLTPTLTGGLQCTIQAYGSKVHMVFDDTEGILYMRNPTANYVSITNINSNLPDKFSLSQNYPNPFNPQTKIKFAVPSNVKGQMSNVKLVIFDLLGREVATLVNEELKPGTYEADWDGSDYSSGVYFYKLVVGDPSTTAEAVNSSGWGFVETKKMVLMK